MVDMHSATICPLECSSLIYRRKDGQDLLHRMIEAFHCHLLTWFASQLMQPTIDRSFFLHFAKKDPHLFSWCLPDFCFLGTALARFVRPLYFGCSLPPFDWPPTNSVRASLHREMAGFSSHTLILSLLLHLTFSAPSSPIANSYLPPPPETDDAVLAGARSDHRSNLRQKLFWLMLPHIDWI